MEINLLKNNESISEPRKKYAKLPKNILPQRLIANIWCHQCKMKKGIIVCCDNFFKRQKDERCNGKYCENCVARHYGVEVEELKDKKEWKCFKCEGTCVCASCKRERGENIPVKKRKRKDKSLSSSTIASPSQLISKKKKKTSEFNPFTFTSEGPKSLPSFKEMDLLAEAASVLASSKERSPSFDFSSPFTSANNSFSFTSANNSFVFNEIAPKKEIVENLRSQISSLKEELQLLKSLVLLPDNQSFSAQEQQLPKNDIPLLLNPLPLSTDQQF